MVLILSQTIQKKCMDLSHPDITPFFSFDMKECPFAATPSAVQVKPPVAAAVAG